ncbi:mechanosensitive ion channel family protein [Maribellus maritimus]|uniref:mechanosensitive ion channel family protein n=1 Tax=Maribellus maritimus TaxID=2870838 RepID=UPI001EEBF23A|nr:mechanosensitive ion channel family protein [Maribellus maritimus]MCG6186810.1 mechanosensitive ion channel family protein [Maribellus maritimus]
MNLDLSKYISNPIIEKIVIALIILIVGFIVIHALTFIVKKFLPQKWSRQRKMIVTRFVEYSGYIFLFFILISALNLSDKLTTIFGAAGVIGIIIGFASQTSIGNIISGFFLVSEKSFELGDVIKIGDKSGVVYSIDLLSIKIKTFDNLLLRIPNQTVISSEVTNVTRFPIRRLDFNVSVAYKEDLRKVKTVLEQVAKNNPLSLDEPEPLIVFKDFGDSGINILLGIWFEKANYLAVKNSIFQEIKEAFDSEGIEIPFPHVSLYAGEATKPFPLVVRKEQKAN